MTHDLAAVIPLPRPPRGVAEFTAGLADGKEAVAAGAVNARLCEQARDILDGRSGTATLPERLYAVAYGHGVKIGEAAVRRAALRTAGAVDLWARR